MLYRFVGIERTSRAFRRKLERVAQRLQTDPNYLAATMQTESGFDPAAYNPTGGGGGLIGFMPATARALGTTVARLRRMTDAQQLAYVERFYRPFVGRLNSARAVKLATFLPAFIDAPDSKVLGVRGSTAILEPSDLQLGTIYEQNAGLDLDGDGTITAGEVGATATSAHDAAVKRGVLDPSPKAQAALAACRRLLLSAWLWCWQSSCGGDVDSPGA